MFSSNTFVMNIGMQKNVKNGNDTHRRIKTDFSENLEHKLSHRVDKSIKSRVLTQRTRYLEKPIISLKRQTNKQSELPIILVPGLHYNYNKWYIRPEIRMKKSLVKEMKFKEEDSDFAYNQLYAVNTLQEDQPFLISKNEKLKLVEKIPVNNIKLLEAFKRSQESKKKRVPKIIELFLEKKGSPEKSNEEFTYRLNV